MLIVGTDARCYIQEESPTSHQGDQGIRNKVHGTLEINHTGGPEEIGME